MRLIDQVISKCFYVGRMAYDADTWGWKWVEGGSDIPKWRGIYFLLSSRGIEKVGSARGQKGMKRRFADYVRRCKRLRTEDRTCVLWDRVMTGEMKGEEIRVYCMEIDDSLQHVETALGCVEVNSGFVLGVEAHYFSQAVTENEPMRLCGMNP